QARAALAGRFGPEEDVNKVLQPAPAAAGFQLRDAEPQLFEPIRHGALERFALGLEMPVECAVGDTGRLGQAVDPGTAKTFPAEELAGGYENARPGLLLVLGTVTH